jgi:NAD-dependent SIR2 family protein deacetylase
MPPRRLSSPAKKAPSIRHRLAQYYSLDHAVSLLKSAKNIIVLTGAGISTSLGMPDFRSANGVYSLLADSIYDDPQELFQIDNFKTNPEEFFKQAAKVFPKMQPLESKDGSATSVAPKFSPTHAFIAMLHARGTLLTNYTQNIDGLEVVAGISPARLVQCHGTLATATCMSCGKRTTARKYMPVVQEGNIPYCKCKTFGSGGRPQSKSSRLGGRKGKKKRKRDEYEDTDSEEEASSSGFPTGLFKPDMTFFGEEVPDVYAPRLRIDRGKVDLLVMIGTSLKVEPVNEMPFRIPSAVPQIWISKDRCQRDGVKVDIELLGECDLIMEEIARRAGWERELSQRLWRSDRSFEPKPTKGRRADSRPDTTNPMKQDNSTSPTKAEIQRPLQIRQKSYDTPTPTSTSGTEVVIKVNGKEIPPDATDTGLQVKPAPFDPKRVKEEPLGLAVAVKISEEMPDRKPMKPAKPDKDADVNKAVKPPSRPQVYVELEEGTRNRWYIRRAR